MIGISELLISTPRVDRRLLAWDNDNTGTSNIEVLRSHLRDGAYETVASLNPDVREYEDTINAHIVNREFFYKLRQDGEEIGPVMVSSAGDRLAAHAVFLYDRALQRNLGTACKVYVKKTTGERCVECWDEYLERSDDPDCATCKGTGYTEGYYSGIEALIAFPKENDSLIATDAGERSPRDVSRAWLTNYPIVHPSDIVMRLFDSTFWRVENPVVKSAKKLYLIRQELQLSQLPRGDVEYTLT